MKFTRFPPKRLRTVALRTQQIIAEETGVVNTIDPLAGSYFIEALTNRMEEDAARYIGRSMNWAGSSGPSRSAIPSRRSRTRRTPTRNSWSGGKGSSSE